MSGSKRRYLKLNPRKQKGIGLLLAGATPQQVSEEMGVTDRAVRKWRAEFQTLFLEENPVWFGTIGRLVEKSLAVYETYLNGEGKAYGGDLTAATNLLKAVGILQAPDRAEVAIQLNQHVERHRGDIVINPQPDEEFARGAMVELERMLRISGNQSMPWSESK